MQEPQITASDDGFHFGQISDRWWETETCWFSFYNIERKLGSWIYIMARPNIGSVAGGAWVWDDTAHLPWEVLYSANYTTLRLPKARDLYDIVLPTGASVKMIEPLRRYEVGYRDGDRIKISLTFDAVTPPVALISTQSAFGHMGHFDQFGRVVGEVVLKGERVAIDCLAMRDRSWGPRPEHRPKLSSYVTGITASRVGFLAVTDPSRPGDEIVHGFVCRDGQVSRLIGGNRVVERDPAHGWTRRIRIEGIEESGRRLTAVGEAVNRIIINRHTFIDSNSLIRWRIEAEEGWGEDQDIWPVHLWADMRRGASAERL